MHAQWQTDKWQTDKHTQTYMFYILQEIRIVYLFCSSPLSDAEEIVNAKYQLTHVWGELNCNLQVTKT